MGEGGTGLFSADLMSTNDNANGGIWYTEFGSSDCSSGVLSNGNDTVVSGNGPNVITGNTLFPILANNKM